MSYNRWGIILAAALLLAGCGGGGGGGGNGGAPATTDFTTFVKDRLTETADTTDPVDINGLDFNFEENPAAFDDVL